MTTDAELERWLVRDPAASRLAGGWGVYAADPLWRVRANERSISIEPNPAKGGPQFRGMVALALIVVAAWEIIVWTALPASQRLAPGLFGLPLLIVMTGTAAVIRRFTLRQFLRGKWFWFTKAENVFHVHRLGIHLPRDRVVRWDTISGMHGDLSQIFIAELHLVAITSDGRPLSIPVVGTEGNARGRHWEPLLQPLGEQLAAITGIPFMRIDEPAPFTLTTPG